MCLRIEQAYSKLKGYLRGACARSHETLMDVIGEALIVRSALRMPRTSSTIVATGQWFNLYDSRCSTSSNRYSPSSAVRQVSATQTFRACSRMAKLVGGEAAS